MPDPVKIRKSFIHINMRTNMKEKLELSGPPGEKFISNVLEFFAIWQTQVFIFFHEHIEI